MLLDGQHDAATTAIDLWDALAGTEAFNILHARMENTEGHRGMVEYVVNLVPLVDTAWRHAARSGYDEPFDWGFCPLFLREVILNGRTDAREIAAVILAQPPRTKTPFVNSGV